MTWDRKVDSILQRLAEVDSALLDDLVGCSEDDIASLEESFDHRLPEAFNALLRRCGRSWGDLMRGEDSSFPQMIGYREVAEALLDELADDLAVDLSSDVGLEDLGVSLPKGAFGLVLDARDFVFQMHQGYQFLFFRVDESEDPPVYHYNDDDPGFNMVFPSFTGWLEFCIEEEVACRTGARR